MPGSRAYRVANTISLRQANSIHLSVPAARGEAVNRDLLSFASQCKPWRACPSLAVGHLCVERLEMAEDHRVAGRVGITAEEYDRASRVHSGYDKMIATVVRRFDGHVPDVWSCRRGRSAHLPGRTVRRCMLRDWYRYMEHHGITTVEADAHFARWRKRRIIASPS